MIKRRGKKNSPPPPEAPENGEPAVETEDLVRLPPLLGIRPGVYLAWGYGFVILIVLFLVLVLPGISHPGSILVVRSEPEGAAVRVDGVYMDTSPCEVFVPQGRREIALVLPGFEPIIKEETIPGRLVGSLLFPRRIPLEGTLRSSDPLGALAAEAGEYAAWSFTGEPTAAYQVPRALSEAAYRLGPSVGAEDEGAGELLAAAARFAANRGSLRDLLRAKFLLDNRGLSPSPLSLAGSLGDMAAYLEENPQAALWLAEVLQGEEQKTLTASAWYREAAGPGEATPDPGWRSGVDRPVPGTVVVNGISYREVPGGQVPGATVSGRAPGERFFIAERPVDAATWEAFLEAEPAWREAGAGGSGGPGTAAAGVSWYAAQAFCARQTRTLPPDWGALSPRAPSPRAPSPGALSPGAPSPGRAGWEVRLPREAEWEQAVAQGLLSGVGDYWEWCGDPFAPLDYLKASPEAIAAVSSPEFPVKGGSWANSSGSVDYHTRGSLPPSTSSPFVSFRPVLAPRPESVPGAGAQTGAERETMPKTPPGGMP
jgi:hypothetical protein